MSRLLTTDSSNSRCSRARHPGGTSRWSEKESLYNTLLDSLRRLPESGGRWKGSRIGQVGKGHRQQPAGLQRLNRQPSTERVALELRPPRRTVESFRPPAPIREHSNAMASLPGAGLSTMRPNLATFGVAPLSSSRSAKTINDSLRFGLVWSFLTLQSCAAKWWFLAASPAMSYTYDIYVRSRKSGGDAMEPKGAIRYSKYTDTSTGKHSVRIVVANRGDVIIEDIKVEFVYDYETPIVGELPGEGGEPVKHQDASGRLGFGLAADEGDGPLRKGEERKFRVVSRRSALAKDARSNAPGKAIPDCGHHEREGKGGDSGRSAWEVRAREFPECETVDLSAVVAGPEATGLNPSQPLPEERPGYNTHFAPYVDPAGHKGVSVCITNQGATPIDTFELPSSTRKNRSIDCGNQAVPSRRANGWSLLFPLCNRPFRFAPARIARSCCLPSNAQVAKSGGIAFLGSLPPGKHRQWRQSTGDSGAGIWQLHERDLPAA